MDLVKCRMCGAWEGWNGAYRITPCADFSARSVWFCSDCEKKLEKMMDRTREALEESE